jgi:hypothetical protein
MIGHRGKTQLNLTWVSNQQALHAAGICLTDILLVGGNQPEIHEVCLEHYRFRPTPIIFQYYCHNLKMPDSNMTIKIILKTSFY